MLEKLKGIIGKIYPEIDMSKVDENTNLVEDLGFDSLALIMMSMEIEDAFNFRFDKVVKFDTVGDVCEYLKSRE